MKKFVSMDVINRVFDDMVQIDYITVSNVTDSQVDLQIYLNSLSVPKCNDTLDVIFRERAFILGNMLDRKINLSFVPNSVLGFLKLKIKNWFT